MNTQTHTHSDEVKGNWRSMFPPRSLKEDRDKKCGSDGGDLCLLRLRPRWHFTNLHLAGRSFSFIKLFFGFIWWNKWTKTHLLLLTCWLAVMTVTETNKLFLCMNWLEMILKRCLITDTNESDDDVVKGLSLSLSLFYACSYSDSVVSSECCQKSYVTFSQQGAWARPVWTPMEGWSCCVWISQ